MVDVEGMLKQAMKSKDAVALSAWRAVKSKMGAKLTEAGRNQKPLDAQEVLQLIRKESREREEANQFLKPDQPEFQENVKIIAILGQHIPKQLSPEEATAVIQKVIGEVGAKTPQDMGKVMGALKKSGVEMDMGFASAKVKELLG
ncbi:MAG: GatB/YqeY domain-containing protein [Deltaproteobacteria bacterium]|nr:GatB/YqeY domain-containing protein [Deltaproteobacteria bacterium]